MEKTQMPKTASVPEPVTEPAPAPAASPVQTAAAAPKKNNALVIILVILGVLILCCGGGALLSYYLAQRAVTSVTDQLSNPTTAAGIVNNVLDKTLNTDTTTGAFGKLVSNWPSDVPVMANAEILYSGSSKESDGTSFNLSYTLTGKQTDMETFYKSEMVKNSWTLDSESTSYGYSMTFKKGNNTATVNIMDDTDGKILATISVTVK